MTKSRVVLPVMFIVAFGALAGCASAPPERLAARDCKVVVADFAGKPAKNVTPAEQAAAEMQMSRLAMVRGGYGIGNNVFADVARECY